MKIYKKRIWTIIALNFLFVYLLIAVNLKSITAPFFESAFWFVPVFSIVPSFLLAMLVTVLFYKEGREVKIQFYCQLSGLILMLCFFTYSVVQQKIKHWQYEANTNHLSIEDSPKELEKALHVIKNQFTSTTKLSVSSYRVSNEDIEEVRDRKASYAIYFTYYLNSNSTTEFYSKLIALDSTYKIEVLNGNPKLNPEVSYWRYGIDNELLEDKKHGQN
jgi:hypothetical protein